MAKGDHLMNRRAVLNATGVAVGTVLAGCSSGAEASDDQPGEDGSEDNTGGGTGDGSSSDDFDGWMADVNNYETIADLTGQSEVSVETGAEGNGGGYAFASPAIRVTSGTTVVWEWTGLGGSHNVIDTGGSFESELTQEEGHTFEHSFDTRGTYKYYCQPHKAMGMKGVVVVE